jgi:hypothetical protein
MGTLLPHVAPGPMNPVGRQRPVEDIKCSRSAVRLLVVDIDAVDGCIAATRGTTTGLKSSELNERRLLKCLFGAEPGSELNDLRHPSRSLRVCRVRGLAGAGCTRDKQLSDGLEEARLPDEVDRETPLLPHHPMWRLASWRQLASETRPLWPCLKHHHRARAVWDPRWRPAEG